MALPRAVPLTTEDPDEVRADRLEILINRLTAQQISGQIGYWAAFDDAGGLSHFAFTADPTYACLSPENGARRVAAVAAFRRAIERNRAALDQLRFRS